MIVASPVLSKVQDGWRVQISDALFDWMEITDGDVAQGIHRAALLLEGQELTKSDLFNLPVPVTEEENLRWADLLRKFHPERLEAEKVEALRALDRNRWACSRPRQS